MFLFWSGTVGVVHAQDLYVQCDTKDCTPTTFPTLFSSSTLWAPGMSEERFMHVQNNTIDQALRVRARFGHVVKDHSGCQMDDQMVLSVTRSGTSDVLWAASLAHVGGGEYVMLDEIAPGTIYDYTLTMTMRQSAPDACQGQTTGFDLDMRFDEERYVPSPTPTPTPKTPPPLPSFAPTPKIYPTPKLAECDAPSPKAPTKVHAETVGSQIILSWDEPPEHVGYYLVAYGRYPGVLEYGNPNIGGPGTGRYAISGLTPSTRYCLQVRAGNRCAAGPFSDSLCVVTEPQRSHDEPVRLTTSNTGAPPSSHVLEGFSPLGGLVHSRPSQTALGRVLGVFDRPTLLPPSHARTVPVCQNCIWWPFYLFQIGAYMIYAQLLVRLRHHDKLVLGPMAIMVGVVANVLFLIFNKACLSIWHGVVYVPTADNPFCSLLLMWSLAIYLVFLTIWGLLLYTPPILKKD